jgi:hypothetical protein
LGATRNQRDKDEQHDGSRCLRQAPDRRLNPELRKSSFGKRKTQTPFLFFVLHAESTIGAAGCRETPG